ncbi:hypothetical protein Ciccas_013191, partial [Cichlidogyrus casuarinus]
MSSKTTALVPYRSNPIGGRPALYVYKQPSYEESYDTAQIIRHEASSEHFPSCNTINWVNNPPPLQHNYYQRGPSEDFQQRPALPFFKPKTTTIIRKLHPSEVFDGSNDFEDGGIIFDPSNSEYPPIATGQSKALVPVKHNQFYSRSFAKGSANEKALVKVVASDQVDDDFHFSAKDFEQGHTTYYPMATLFNKLNISGGNDEFPQIAWKRQQQPSRQGCGNPSCQNCGTKTTLTKQPRMVENIMDMSKVYNTQGVHPNNQHHQQENEDPDNRTTYGYAEFQAARQRFEQICSQGGDLMGMNRPPQKENFNSNMNNEMVHGSFYKPN